MLLPAKLNGAEVLDYNGVRLAFELEAKGKFSDMMAIMFGCLIYLPYYFILYALSWRTFYELESIFL